MTFVLLSGVWLWMLAPAPLEQAQRAFDDGRYEDAERLALPWTKPPQAGAAWTLVGLARFRNGEPARALEALQKASTAADAPEPAMGHFNQGACLFALGRFSEAEQAFLEAATLPSLKALALVQAAWAAYEQGNLPAARKWLRASSAKEAADSLWALLEANHQAARAQYEGGLSAFDLRKFEEARAFFVKAQHLDDAFGAAFIMGGASAWRLGLFREAEWDFEKARSLELSAEEARTTAQYLDRLSMGLRGQRPGLSFEAQASAGVDTNVSQAGVGAREGFLPQSLESASPLIEANLLAGYRSDAWRGLLFDTSLSFSQRAYTQPTAEDYSLQASRFSVVVETDRKPFFLGASLVGEVAFTGLSAFRGLLSGPSGSVYAAWQPSPEVGARLSLGAGLREAFLSEFSYLSGNRWNVSLSGFWQRERWRVSGWAVYRLENLGTLKQETTVELPLLCRGQCTFAQYVLPFAWAGPGAGAELRYRWPTGQALRFEADVEPRFYAGTTRLELTDSRGVSRRVGEKERVDVRQSGALTASWPLWNSEFSLRYEFVWNTSNVDTRLENAAGACTFPDFNCHEFDATNANYSKHLVLLGVSFL
jgi:tetratricopeptide (TPR) repeat protein